MDYEDKKIDLVINYLTAEKYEELADEDKIKDDELYVTDEKIDSIPTRGSSAFVLSDGIRKLSDQRYEEVKGELSSKADLVDGKVPMSQLPTIGGGVLEYPNRASLPSVGEPRLIYVTTDDNKQYRWAGSDYEVLSPSIPLGETEGTAYEGSKGKEVSLRVSALQTEFTDFAYNISYEKEDKANKVSLGADNTYEQYPNAKSVWDYMTNIVEIAEGKCKAVSISLNPHVPTEEDFEYTELYKKDGTRIATFAEFTQYISNDYTGEPLDLANAMLNSQNLQISLYLTYLLVNKGTSVDRKYIVLRFDTDMPTFFRNGDIINIVDLGVPDRWIDNQYGDIYANASETAKVDLTNVAKTNVQNTFTEDQTFDKIYANNIRGTTALFLNSNAGIIYTNSTFAPSNTTLNIGLGNATYKWNDLYLKGKIVLGTTELTETYFSTVAKTDTANTFTASQVFNGLVYFHNVYPYASENYSLGSASNKFKDLYLSGAVNVGANCVISERYDGKALAIAYKPSNQYDYTVSIDGAEVMTTHLRPKNSSCKLGTSSAPWNTVFTIQLTMGQTTIDGDDLKAIKGGESTITDAKPTLSPMQANTLYICQNPLDILEIVSFATATNPLYEIKFRTAEAFTGIFPDGMNWVNGTPSFEPNTEYALYIEKGISGYDAYVVEK